MKKNIKFLFLSLCLLSFLAFSACKSDADNDNYKGLQSPDLPASLYNYTDVEIPAHFNNGFYDVPTPAEMGVTNSGATLGRVLFYDTKLSLSNEVSCSSCHLQNKAFSDKVALSEGIINNTTPRNSQAIINPIMEQTYFWDSRISNLEEMVLMPIQNHNELGMEKLDDLVSKLGQVDYYPALFEETFGDDQVSEERIASALTQFLRSMFSAESKFDEVLTQELNQGSSSGILSAKEAAGRVVFEESGCNGCHGGSDLRGQWGDDWANIGLDMEYEDKGLGETGQFFGGDGFFKIPSLRNIALTGPYMHDGRFATLSQVIDHYNEGIQAHPNLDWRLQDNSGGSTPEPQRLNLTDDDKENLITFLNTFTDHSLITDQKFSDPFGR